MDGSNTPGQWDEATSQRYLDYGRYFVPEREQQMKMMADLISTISQPGRVIELCCGEGLLAEVLLDSLPELTYLGLDGSALMLEQARLRLQRFKRRVSLRSFELAGNAWRNFEQPALAVVSSLAIHHLEGEQKRSLFKDVHGMLVKGGVFIIADIVEPSSAGGTKLAADGWDEVVQKRSFELDGSAAGFEFFRRESWNIFRYPDPEDIDHPSPLFFQLKWLEQAGFGQIEVHLVQAGHALFSGWKLDVG